MATFEEAFEKVVGHEAGYQRDPADPGNWTGGKVGVGELRGTNLGISAAAYPHEDIAGMTLERSRELYRRDYWGPASCDAIPQAARYAHFDMAVNSGVKAANKALQKAVGEIEDGIIGPRTLTAAGSMPGPRLVARMCAARLALMTNLPTFDRFGRGWTRRVLSILQEA